MDELRLKFSNDQDIYQAACSLFMANLDIRNEHKAEALRMISTLELDNDTLKQTISKKPIHSVSDLNDGVFVIALEDEFRTVREAAVDALYELGLKSEEFSNISLGFLIDMFNDEDASVRLTAAHSFNRLNRKWDLFISDSLVESIILIILDSDMKVRLLAYEMVHSIHFQTFEGLDNVISLLFKCLRDKTIVYQEQLEIYRALSGLAQQHQQHIQKNYKKYLQIQDNYIPQEQHIKDTSHLAALVLIFNSKLDTKVLPRYVIDRYDYLRCKLGNIIPDCARGSIKQFDDRERRIPEKSIMQMIFEIALKFQKGIYESQKLLQDQIK